MGVKVNGIIAMRRRSKLDKPVIIGVIFLGRLQIEILANGSALDENNKPSN